MQDPSPYLQDLGIGMESALNPRLRAQIEDAYLSRVNYDVLLAVLAETHLDEDRLDYCGVVTDPVTKQRFRPAVRSPRCPVRRSSRFFLLGLDPGLLSPRCRTASFSPLHG
ncbi:MAG: hypothetical protein R3E12_16405 [Candidatus Eisenbacteria bacterium]